MLEILVAVLFWTLMMLSEKCVHRREKLMKFKDHSPETVAELLVYLADHEPFQSVKEFKGFTRTQTADILKEVAAQLKQTGQQEGWIKRQSLGRQDIPNALHHVIAALSPKEEETLWKSFKIS